MCWFPLNIYIYTQCAKLRFYFVHLPGAKTPKMVHPAINSCVTHYINLFKSWEKHAHTGCTRFKIHAPGSQHVHGAPLISNTEYSKIPPAPSYRIHYAATPAGPAESRAPLVSSQLHIVCVIMLMMTACFIVCLSELDEFGLSAAIQGK